MTGAEYRRTTERDLLGRRYRLASDVRRRDDSVIAKGTIVEVRRKFGGLTVRTDRCEHCGVQLAVRLDPADLGERVS